MDVKEPDSESLVSVEYAQNKKGEPSSISQSSPEGAKVSRFHGKGATTTQYGKPKTLQAEQTQVYKDYEVEGDLNSTKL
jgi:hypothetical protein